MTQALTNQARLTVPRVVVPDVRLIRHSRSYLLAGFLYFTFVGFHTFSGSSASERVDGSLVDRLAVLGLSGLAVFVLGSNWERARACLLANTGQICIVGFAALSVFWSEFPDLTMRRAILLGCLTMIALAVVASIVDLRRFHSFVFAALTLVIAANCVAVLLIPGRAVSDMGVNGLYSQKNQAGAVAMIAVVVGFGWVLGARRRSEMVKGALALALTLVFLCLTRSKTSIGLTGLGIGGMAYFALVERWGARFILISISGLLLAFSSVLVAFAAFDCDFGAALTALAVDVTFTGRDQLWAFAWGEACKFPWFGHGYGAFWDVGYANDPILRAETGTWLSTTEVGVINQAHNGYLELWLELGWPAAVVAALTILKGAASGGRRAVFGTGSRQERAAFGAFGMLLLLQLLHNCAEATLFMRGMTYSNVASLSLFVIASRANRLPGRR